MYRPNPMSAYSGSRLKPDNTAKLLLHQDVLGVGWALFGLHG